MKQIGWIERSFSHIRYLGRLTPGAAVSAFLPMAGWAVLAVFAYPLAEWLRANPQAGAPIFALGVAVFCGFAILPPNLIGIISGWSFGVTAGIAALMAGLIFAAGVSFVIASRFSGERLPSKIDRYPRLGAAYKALLHEHFGRTVVIVMLLRLSFSPFALTNFLLAATRMSFPAYIIGTAIGMLPRSAAMVFIGAGLSEFAFESGRDPLLLLMVIIATLAAVFMIAYFSRRALAQIIE
jgi:uncharacterized membrane protein YdjX (TVP38/TMEM64 family)